MAMVHNGHSRKINILLVDDRPEGLLTLEAVLDRPNYNLVKAESGEQALARVLETDFAVILMDVQMPGMDGFETVGLIKQREKSKDIPVIFLTAISKETHFVRRGYQTGAVDYLFKPFDPQVLASKVAVLVDLHMKTLLVKEQSELLRQSEMRERARQLATFQLESLNRYRHLADAIPHIIWKIRDDGNLDYCNRYWQDYSGTSFDDNVGSGWRFSVHTEDLHRLMALWKNASLTGHTLETECRLKRHDGDYRWHMFRGVPEFHDAGSLGSWIITNTDIDDRKRVEQALQKAKDESIAANEAKTTFLANMSHEIRTPLGAVLGFSELLGNPEIALEERSNCLSAIKRNGDLLSRLIGDVLDLSKIEAGHLDIEKVKFSLVDLLWGAQKSLEHQANEKGIRLGVSVTSPLPETVYSDPTRLRQIIFNIVGNAIKFTPSGAVVVEISSEKNGVGKHILSVSVTDQGSGITEDQGKKLFRPFMQADSSTTRKYGGTGLGLSLSRKLARKMGGDVVLADSTPGIGSTFLITIAVDSNENVRFVKALDQAVPVPIPPRIDGQLKGIQILLVEDSPDNQVLITRFLNMAGAQVEVADNGQEGVKKAMIGHHDIVLMDIQMPVLDGYKATRELRNLEFDKPILALTAHALQEERERCLSAGCNDHLTKPVNREDLLSRVAYHVHLSKDSARGKLRPSGATASLH
jgi:two-component system, sensor histidine kinase